jgi:hypothetical protein
MASKAEIDYHTQMLANGAQVDMPGVGRSGGPSNLSIAEQLKTHKQKTRKPALWKTSLYEIKHISHSHGFGVFAAKDIPKGTRITSEKPLLNSFREPDTCDPLQVYELFTEKLADVEQEVYLKLSASLIQTQNALECMDDDLDPEVSGLVSKVWSIFETNAFNIGEPDEEGVVMAGVFELASRFNHSCRPNVAQTFNVNSNQLTIHAIRHITKGEEMCDSYVPLCQPAEARKAELRAYGFDCTCEVCMSPLEHLAKSDENRAMIKRLGEDVNFFLRRRRASVVGPVAPALTREGRDDPLNVVEYIEALLKEEGLEGHDLAQ